MKLVDISKLTSSKSLLSINEYLEKLTKDNLDKIRSINQLQYTFPLNLESILLFLIAFEYKISITTLMALYQLYANDLIVIASTLLHDKNLDDSFIYDGNLLLKKLKTKDNNTILTERTQKLYDLIKYNVYDNKMYISANLW